MFSGSKALKDESPRKSPWYASTKAFAWWVDTEAYRLWHHYSWKYFFKHLQDLKKTYNWYKEIIRPGDYDFDAQSLFPYIRYKLERVKRCLDRGWAIQDEKDMHALSLAIKLAKRIEEDKYEEIHFSRHDRKWGESKHWFEPCNDGSDCSYMRSSRPGVVTEADKEQEHKEFRQHMEDSYAQHSREVKWLFAIIAKYYRTWWD